MKEKDGNRESPLPIGADDEILDVLLRDVFDTPRHLSRLGALLGDDGAARAHTLGSITLDSIDADFQSAQRRRIEEMEEDLLGSRIGGYEIIERVGKGGMGLVFRARQESPLFTREVAMKFPIPREATATADREKFVAEAKGLAALSHPNLVPIFDSGTEGGLIFFTMELVDGRQLDEWARTVKPSVEERVRLVRDVALALDYLHEHQVVHRDIKPANVLVDAEGRAKLVDFGIAQFSIDARKRAIEAGTPFYVAPEIVDPRGGFGEIGPGADIYALGAVLYFLLYGEEVFAGETDLDSVLEATLRKPVRFPRRAQDGVPRELEPILRRALHKRVEDRYGTVAEMAEALERFLRRRRSRNARRVAFLSVASIVLLALLAPSFLSPPPQADLSPLERSEFVGPYREELDALGQRLEDVTRIVVEDRASGRFEQGSLDGVAEGLRSDFDELEESFDKMTKGRSMDDLDRFGKQFDEQKIALRRKLLDLAHARADAAREPLIGRRGGGVKGPRTRELLRDGLDWDDRAQEAAAADPAEAIHSFLMARRAFREADDAEKAYETRLEELRQRRSELNGRLTGAKVDLGVARESAESFPVRDATARMDEADRVLAEADDDINGVALDSEDPGADLLRLDGAEGKLARAEGLIRKARDLLADARTVFKSERDAALESLEAFRSRRLGITQRQLPRSLRARITGLDESLRALEREPLDDPTDLDSFRSTLVKLDGAFKRLLDDAVERRQTVERLRESAEAGLQEVTSKVAADRLPRGLAPLHEKVQELLGQGVESFESNDCTAATKSFTEAQGTIQQLADGIERQGLGDRMIWIPPRGPDDAVPGFWIDRYETTIGDWLEFLNAARQDDHEHCCGKGKPARSHQPIGWDEQLRQGDRRLPVIGVRPEDALAYARYRRKSLPDTELWSRVASSSAPASARTSKGPGELDRRAVNGAGSDDGHVGLAPVDVRLGMSPHGAHHAAGNAPEWIVVDGQPAALAGGSFETPDPHYLRAERIVRVPQDASRDSFVRLAGLRLVLRGRANP